MCTVSWASDASPGDASAWVLWCNRDERRSRPSALPPSLHERDGVRWIAPVDPVGGGSWLWANEYGVVASLLNFYDAKPSPLPSPLRSRGQLLMELASCGDLEQMGGRLRDQLRRHHHAPFWLVALKSIPDAPPQPCLWCWDGHQLSAEHEAISNPLPISSSSWNTGPVLQERREQFQKALLNRGAKPKVLRDYHLSHSPRGEEWGPYMTRESSRTVSVSEIRIRDRDISFRYRQRLDDTELSAPVETCLPRVQPSSPVSHP